MLAHDRLAIHKADATHEHHSGRRFDVEFIGNVGRCRYHALVHDMRHKRLALPVERLSKGDWPNTCRMRDARLCDKCAAPVLLNE